MGPVPDVSVPAVLVAAVVAFVLSGAYYGVLGTTGGRDLPGWAVPAVELPRNLVVSAVVGGLAAAAAVDTLGGGLLLGLALWVGFPLVLWAGAVAHEGTPVRARRAPRGRLAAQAARGVGGGGRLALMTASQFLAFAGTCTTVYVVVGVGGVPNRALGR